MEPGAHSLRAVVICLEAGNSLRTLLSLGLRGIEPRVEIVFCGRTACRSGTDHALGGKDESPGICDSFRCGGRRGRVC